MILRLFILSNVRNALNKTLEAESCHLENVLIIISLEQFSTIWKGQGGLPGENLYEDFLEKTSGVGSCCGKDY